MKTCVLLLQLGTPDSPKKSDVRKYLKEFLNDPRVIDLPAYKRKPLVNGIIVPFRAPKSAKIYQELWDMSDGKSPLLVHSVDVKEKLQKKLGDKATVELAMRYGNPSMDSVMEKIRKDNYDKIVIFPLYPQYASASTGSCIEKAFKIISKWWVTPQIETVNQFYDNELFIDAIIENANKYNWKDYDHVLFSYHGLPERQLDKVYKTGLCKDQNCETEFNDTNKFCYKATSYETTRLIASRLGMTEKDYTVCFQSRLDDKWVTPYSDAVVEERAKDGDKKLLVFSPAFVADCLETIIEIGDEYQEIFEEHGGEKVQLVESLNSNDKWIDSLEDILKPHLAN